MNKELLFQLYCIHSKSGSEKKMRRFLRKVAKECGATSIETDPYGNLLIVKGESDTYPCLAAHMDQVQDSHSKDFMIVPIGDDVIGWSPKCHEQQGLGADDKNGLFICLELLRRFDVMKVAFFVGEEVGCKGSSNVDLKFFKDCRFIIEPDRKGSSDLITNMFCGQVCSKHFIDAIGYKDYGYIPTQGSITDVGELVERGVGISCLNLSCGYYDPHSDQEITVLSHLQNCMDFVGHIVETCQEVYPFEYEYGYGRYDYYDWYGKKSTNKGTYQWLNATQQAQTDKKDKALVDEEAYWFDGYYDFDRQMIQDYMHDMPDITKEQLMSDLMPDFYVNYFFPNEECASIVEDLYYEVIDEMYYTGLGNDGEDTMTVGELVADMQEHRKAS